MSTRSKGQAKTEKGTKNASDQGNSISFPTVSSDLIEDEFIYSLLDPDSGSLANSRVCSTEHGSPSASTTGSANFLVIILISYIRSLHRQLNYPIKSV